jgi:hypothetical protein
LVGTPYFIGWQRTGGTVSRYDIPQGAVARRPHDQSFFAAAVCWTGRTKMSRIRRTVLPGVALVSLLVGAVALPWQPMLEAEEPASPPPQTAPYPVGMGQVWDASLIPELRKRGFNGSLIQFYASTTPAKLEHYMRVAAEHGFRVMPAVRPEYLEDRGRSLAELAAVARRFPNLWGWHCEGKYVDDKEKMALVRDIVGKEYVVKFDDSVNMDESITRRYSRLWYPKVRCDTDKGEEPVWGRERGEIYSTYPLWLLQKKVQPPNTFEIWLQAYGVERPEQVHVSYGKYYIPPNVEDMIYWSLMSQRAGARAIWWYTLSCATGEGREPMWEARPQIWKALCQATDFLLTGEVPKQVSTGRYLVLESPAPR